MCEGQRVRKMKTISEESISTKQISISKAAKILSNFVSAENGASQVISAYLHRAYTSFDELNQLHKELKSSRSHQKHKRHRTENVDQDDEKSTQTVVKFSQEANGSIGYHAGNMGGSEKHKKNKKRQQEVESRDHRDIRVEFGEREGEDKLPTRAQNEIEPGQVQGDEGEGNMGVVEGKKQKREKKKEKKDKEGACNFSINKVEAEVEVENPEGESAMGSGHQKEIEKKLCNGVEGENRGLVDTQDPQIKKKKKYEAGSDIKLYAEEVNMVQKKKRKNEHLEGRVEDRSGDLSKKRMKRTHEGDH